jgi:tetratricopeptide (TPR) repeat protein
MSRLHEMMEELEDQRRKGNFRGAENIAKLEMKNYELEKNTPYYNFYRGMLWYLYDFPHEAMMYFNNSLLTEDRDMYYVHKFRGVVHLESGEFKLARAAFEEALGIADDYADIVSAMNGLANSHLRLGAADRALEIYREALEISLNENLDDLTETTLVNIGVAFVNKGDNEAAIPYFEDGMRLAKAIGDDRGMRICLNNIASAFNNMGKHRDALELLNDALHYATKTDDKYGVRVTCTNMGYTYRMMGDVSSALEYYTLALGTAQQINDREGEALAKYWIMSLQKGEERAAAS